MNMDFELPPDEKAKPVMILHDVALWDAFHAMGLGFAAYLIHPSNGTCVWIVGVGQNGRAEFFVEPEVIQELQSYSLVEVELKRSPKGIEEGYKLTEGGQRLYVNFKDMPYDQGAGEFVDWVHKQRRPS